MEVSTEATVCKGRLKNEIVKIIGTTNLNMDFRFICRRKKGHIRIMRFRRDELKQEAENE